MDDADTDGDLQMSQQGQDDPDNLNDDDVDLEWEEVIEEVEVVEEVPIDEPEVNAADLMDEEDKYNEEDNIFGDANDADFGDDDDGFGDDDGGWDDDEAVDDINGDEAIMTGAKSSLFESAIPDITRQAIMSNCDEVNMIPLFAASPDLKSRSRVGCMVAIRVENLSNITTEQLEVWGLTPEFPYIALKFEFGPFFLNEAKVPKVQVGMARSLNPDEPLKAFRLSWTIEERLRNTKLSNEEWPPKGIDMKHIPIASAVQELMESSAREYALCLEALRKCHDDQTEALNLLLDGSRSDKLDQTLPSVHSCEAQFSDIMSKVSTTKKKQKKKALIDQLQEAGDREKILQMVDMYGISTDAAVLAYQALGYEEAVDQLSIVDRRQHWEEMVRAQEGFHDTEAADSELDHGSGMAKKSKKQKKKGYGMRMFGGLFGAEKSMDLADSKEDEHNYSATSLPDFKSMMRTASGGKVQCVEPQHIYRSIVVMNGHNFLLRCLCFALKVLLNGNQYCMICDKKLAFAGLKPTICSERFCQWRHDQIGLGFSLSAEIINREDIVDLLISMTYSASNAGRIQFFFPHAVRGLDADTQTECFLRGANGDELTQEDLDNFNEDLFKSGDASQPKADVDKLKRVIDECPPLSELKEMAKDGDVALKKALTKIDCLLFPLLCWIITSNRCHLKQLAPKHQIKAIETGYQFALCTSTPDREREFQDLRRANGSFLAWHGSAMGNWHSILRMGLRNYSKTKHQTNGAAYGSGIYFARNFNLSWGYCRPGSNPGWSKSKFANMSCMALCEICYHEGDAHHHRNKQQVYAENESAVSASTSKAKYMDHTFGARQKDAQNRWVKTSGIYVVDQEECVMTRFFLIFENKQGYKALEANSLMGSLPNLTKEFK